MSDDQYHASPSATPPAAASQDERLHDRNHGRIEARLWLRGEGWLCWIRDLSMGGAGLEPALPPALGQQVELSSPHFPFPEPIKGRVVNLAHKRTSMVFDLDDQMAERLAAFLADNVVTP